MKRKRTLFPLLLTFGAFLTLSMSTPGQSPTPAVPVTDTDAKKPIVVDVDLVNVIFSVFDKKGKVIADLDQKEVRIREDDGQQTITNFTREASVPLAIALAWRLPLILRPSV